MHIRVNRVRSKGKTYEYPELVHAYRNENGTPCQRVVLSLKGWTPLQIENLRLGLNAARNGKPVVVAPIAARSLQPIIDLSLQFLDVALVLELWKRRGLGELCQQLIPQHEQAVAPADVIAALVVQRLIAPDSKLAAARWFPTTALPELLKFPAGAFNNSRVHRTLDALQEVETTLQARVADGCARHRGFAALYLDSTDTFFIGRGPSTASRGKTKEGRTERKIGIVLLCNHIGEPLRWTVVEGRSADNKLFGEMFHNVRDVDWATGVPIVVDRAMGHTADIRVMAESGLRFLTALTATEFDSYTRQIPRSEVGALPLDLSETDAAERTAQAQLAALVLDHGFEQARDDLFVRDLGVREAGVATAQHTLLAADGTIERLIAAEDGSIRNALAIGLILKEQIAAGKLAGIRAAGEHYGRGKTWAERRVKLTKLPNSIQTDIRSGNADHVALTKLAALAQLPAEQQHAAYDLLIRESPRTSRQHVAHPAVESTDALLVRQVLYFSPSLHLRRRRKLNARLEEACSFVRTLNQSIRDNKKRLSSERLRATAEQELVRIGIRKAFDIDVAPDGTIVLVEREEYLRHLRGRYGFCFLIGHPSLTDSAVELVDMYRAKNEIERDFRNIKSVLELRPVHHRNDDKVKAHVTLCMLALLLLRDLEQLLTASPISAEQALETLASCHLIRMRVGTEDIYAATELNRGQENLIKLMGLRDSLDPRSLASEVTPR